MPYSRSKEKRLAKLTKWPDLRYSPEGVAKLFYSAEEVPFGWSNKHPGIFIDRPTEQLDREDLIKQLTTKNIKIKPTWGNAHMKKVLNGDCSTAW